MGKPNNQPEVDSASNQGEKSKLPLRNKRRIAECVWNAEREYIRRRRQAARIKSQKDDDVGLALSGGGIRSASFNLGFVQALMHRDKFKQVDYLSTVSGGGYLGGFLGAQMAYLQAAPPPDNKEKSLQERFENAVKPKPSGEQPHAVKRLLRSGRYLKRFPSFFNRYLFGMFVVNVWLFSVLAAFGAAAALFFRSIDLSTPIVVGGVTIFPPPMNAAKAAGFVSDFQRAFVWPCLLFLFWVLLWIIRQFFQWRRQTEYTPKLDRMTRVVAMATLMLTVMGVVVVCVTNHIAIPVWDSFAESTPELSSAIHYLAVILVIMQAIAVLPLLRLDKLIQSGAQTGGRRDSIIFNVAGPAIVFGIPLIIFGWFARENISGNVSTPPVNAALPQDLNDSLAGDSVDFADPRLLTAVHFVNWEQFWRTVEERSASERYSLRYPLESKLKNIADAPCSSDITLQCSIDATQAYDRALRHSYPLFNIRWFWPSCKAVQDRDDAQRTVVNRINRHCLTDPNLCKQAVVPNEKFVNPAQSREIAYWKSRVNGLSEETPIGEVAFVNREFIQAYFGDNQLLAPGTVFARTTTSADQWRRFYWMLGFLGVSLFTGLFVINPNVGSLQEFYRERLQYMWLPRRKVCGKDHQRVVLSSLRQPFQKSPRSSNEDDKSHSFPYLILNATAHLFRGDVRNVLGVEPDKLPRETRFEFAPAYCGYAFQSRREDAIEFQRRFEPTETYEEQLYLDLPGVMAISGSAVSPAMTDNFILKTLMFLSNFRLGQWTKQPEEIDCSPQQPTPRQEWGNWLRKLRPGSPRILPCIWQAIFRFQESPRFLFLSDGGHYDNLGLEALLDRRVKTIICVDAGQDENGRFVDLLKVVRRSRFLDGVRITTDDEDQLSHGDLKRLKGSIAEAHFFEATITYPGEREGDFFTGKLYYVKPSFDHDEPAELISYRDENPDFPHDPTLDQFYDERRFECYRALGWHVGLKVINAIPAFSVPHQSTKSVPRKDWPTFDNNRPFDVQIAEFEHRLPADEDFRQHLLMQLKERLLDRAGKSRLTAAERSAVHRLLKRCMQAQNRTIWESSILIECVAAFLQGAPKSERHIVFEIFSNDQLREFLHEFVEFLPKK